VSMCATPLAANPSRIRLCLRARAPMIASAYSYTSSLPAQARPSCPASASPVTTASMSSRVAKVAIAASAPVCLDHHESCILKRIGQQHADDGFVLHDEHDRSRFAHINLRVTRVPLPGFDSRSTVTRASPANERSRRLPRPLVTRPSTKPTPSSQICTSGCWCCARSNFQVVGLQGEFPEPRQGWSAAAAGRLDCPALCHSRPALRLVAWGGAYPDALCLATSIRSSQSRSGSCKSRSHRAGGTSPGQK